MSEKALEETAAKYNETLHRYGVANFQIELWMVKRDEAKAELVELDKLMGKLMPKQTPPAAPGPTGAKLEVVPAPEKPVPAHA